MRKYKVLWMPWNDWMNQWKKLIHFKFEISNFKIQKFFVFFSVATNSKKRKKNIKFKIWKLKQVKLWYSCESQVHLTWATLQWQWRVSNTFGWICEHANITSQPTHGSIISSNDNYNYSNNTPTEQIKPNWTDQT